MINVWLIALVASLGGVAVFVGLCMEKTAERERDGYQTLKDFRKSESRKKIGERFVRWGVFAEVVLGFSVAAFEGWEALKNAPLNAPASVIRAIAVIDINQTNPYPRLDFSVLNNTYLELLGKNIYRDSYFGLIPNTFLREFVHKRNFGPHAPISYIGFAIEFEENPVPAFEPANFNDFVKPPNPPVKEVLNEVKMMRLYLNFVPKTAQIIGGHVILQVNGFPKYFTINKQGTDTNLSAWNPNAPGIFLYATNSVP